MRIIITGGSGMIGKALAIELIEAGHEVIVLSRNPFPGIVPGGVGVEKWDAETGHGWASLITEDTAIVNFAGAGLAEGRWTDERKAEILKSRINAGQAVVDGIQSADSKPRVVIQASAVGYYGPRGDEELTESSSSGDDFLADVCQQWEESTQPVEEMGIRRAITRSGVVLSTKDGAFPRMLLPFKLFVGGPIGSGQQWMPWIHIHDEVRAVRFLIENEASQGVYNLTAPNPVTNGQFATIMGNVMRRPGIVPVPAFVMQTLFGELSTVLLDGQRAVPHRLLEEGFTFEYNELEAAIRDLLDRPAPAAA
jgi:hypothetical protein